uniref:Poly [ADP-ribose] polymerase n=1 Tax=Neolamprologus brichardi TaxID=32507 RepID=A0A3Q4G613_NEOBR
MNVTHEIYYQCFTREFTGQTAQRNVQHEARGFNEVPVQQAVDQSQHSSVLSTSLDVYQMQIDQLTLQASSGDITKEASDVIVNSSNQSFNLKAGVSKAILDGAGVTVEQECAHSTAQPPAMILTSAGQLRSRNIVHVVGQNDPANIKNTVYSVLKFCEENKFSSVAFPALGTGLCKLQSCEQEQPGMHTLFAVAPASNEYNDVEKELTKTGLNLNIISIERVQNPSLWQNYQIMKKQMEVKNKHTNNELLLFHGTTDTSIHLINKQGFNRSYAGKNAAMYGNGSYFAADPCYSAGNYATPDTSGHKRMYQARVLVGDYTQGKKGMITPPPKSGSASDLYDSVIDDAANPTMFVVFNDIQAYPEYLITFT